MTAKLSAMNRPPLAVWLKEFEGLTIGGGGQPRKILFPAFPPCSKKSPEKSWLLNSPSANPLGAKKGQPAAKPGEHKDESRIKNHESWARHYSCFILHASATGGWACLAVISNQRLPTSG